MDREENVTPWLLYFEHLFFIQLVRSASRLITLSIQSDIHKNIFHRYFQSVNTLLLHLLVYKRLGFMPKNLEALEIWKKMTNLVVRAIPQIHQSMYFNKWLRQIYRACFDLHSSSSDLLQWGETRCPCIHEIHEWMS